MKKEKIKVDDRKRSEHTGLINIRLGDSKKQKRK
jgi:hypothetical protein